MSHCHKLTNGCDHHGYCECSCLACMATWWLARERSRPFRRPQLNEVDPYVLPTDSAERKQIPIFSGVLNYFPLAIAAVARVSKRGNDQHNPGEPLHWARGTSKDHEDCIARHLIDVETLGPDGEYDDAMSLAWRALAKLQELEERRLGKPYSRGSR